MDLCRICLNNNSYKDIFQVPENAEGKSFSSIILYCLGIQIVADTKLTTKLCMKCFKKVSSFHKFKLLALKSDEYLKSLNPFINVQNCNSFANNGIKIEIKETHYSDRDHGGDDHSYGDGDSVQIKQEYAGSKEVDSDDELLSVMKKIKYEYVEVEAKDIAPVKKKKGRPKKVKTETTEPRKMCEECGLSVRDLKAHMNIHLPPDQRARIKCKMCDKHFASYSARKKHVQRKHLDQKIGKKHCKLCDKYIIDLKGHTLVMHSPELLKFECLLCARRFLSQSRLDEHMRLHTKDRPFECAQCEQKFRRKSQLQLHTRQVHEKEKSHLCQFCSKSFFKKYHFQLHLRTHTKEKPHECPDCGKPFSSISIMKNHRLTHADVKAFTCTVCEMAFVSPAYLRAHMISHTKVKRYPCQYCGIKFHRSDHRKRHERTAHERQRQPPA